MRASGILNLFKPKGITSHDLVDRVRSILGQRRVGHAGTLDPFADGILLVGFGRGTKILSYLADLPKEYEAGLRLGERTDTLDPQGEIIHRDPVPQLSPEHIESIFSSFVGPQEQTPPVFSAVRIGGRRSYSLARQGKKVSHSPRSITVRSISLISWNTPVIRFKALVSKGTYLRVLASDLAENLGTSGHLVSLRRTRIGDHSLETCSTLSRLEKTVEEGNLSDVALSLEQALDHLPRIVLDDAGTRMMSNGLYPKGHFIAEKALEAGHPATAVGNDGRLVAIIMGVEDEASRINDKNVFTIARILSQPLQ